MAHAIVRSRVSLELSLLFADRLELFLNRFLFSF